MRCPTPYKVRYPTKQVALQSASGIFQIGLVPLRMRAYRCRCHHWHLTKRGAIEAEIRRLLHTARACMS